MVFPHIARFPIFPLIRTTALTFVIASTGFAQNQDQVKGTPAEPSDAAETRQQMEIVEKLKSAVPDRGAPLYFLAAAKQHLGETLDALSLLKEALALREGFDPFGDLAFYGLRETKEFTDLVDNVHRDFPVVARARLAFVTEDKDLIPEGLAYDSKQQVFYLSSMYRRKIVKIAADGTISDLVPPNLYHLLPVLGIRLSPVDNTIWANSFTDEGATELLHFDPTGKLLGRYAPPQTEKHGFNDLVIRKTGEIFLTDSLDNQIFSFDPKQEPHTFTALRLARPLLYPNGIALADDDHQLFVADALGVIYVDLATGESVDVNPGPRSTLSGIDGLYWHNGSLIAIQNGIGSPRVAAFRLSKDGRSVTQTTVLENRTSFTTLPTTGALRENDFYFIANSQIDNLNGGRVMDTTKLERVRIAVIHLP